VALFLCNDIIKRAVVLPTCSLEFYFINFLMIHEAITVAKTLEKVVATKAVIDMKVTLSRL
jgi:hypothetical protein